MTNPTMKFFVISMLLIDGYLCAEMLTKGVSCKDVKSVIDKHNHLRKMVAKGEVEGQPKASNMQKIVWDDKLQQKAQNWANNMKFQHNPDRDDIGENIYMSYGGSPDTEPEWEKAVQSWFDEHKQYIYGPIDDISKTGHYTQVIWAETIHVGCGFTAFKENDMTYKFYVCDYGPAGNVYTVAPYKTGSGCEHLCCKKQCDKVHGDNCQ